MKEILLTGALGFIGRNLLNKLISKNMKIHIIVRPSGNIIEKSGSSLVNPIYVDLEDTNELQNQIEKLNFDTVFHVGAIRGAQKVSHQAYRKVNITATEVLAKISIQKSAKFIFCSSVGVFGAIPKKLPPDEDSERQKDNYYHYTKIEAESRLQKMVKEGLKLIIIRPSITYGLDDFGFPYSLIKMVDRGIFLNCTSGVNINMIDVDTLVKAFLNASELDINSGSAYNISDKNPVEIKTLVDFISKELYKKSYSKIKILPTLLFRFGEFTFGKILKNEAWKARFQLISRSWYYDPQPAITGLKINPKETIPNFRYVIDWYKNVMRNKK